MLNHLLKFALVSCVVIFLRQRWKRLTASAAAILIAAYTHSEYLDYVAALPVGSNEAMAASDYVLLAFVLKNTIIGIAILGVIGPEFRRLKHERSRVDSATRARSKTLGQNPPKIAESDQSQNADFDDGFDFLRRRRKLLTRNDQLIRSKPSK